MKNYNNDVYEWINRAESNLERARIGKDSPKILLEDLCFDCHQCVEKSLKALLISNNIEFPKTHSINLLINLLKEKINFFPEFVLESVILTDYAVEMRYPGNYEKITSVDYFNAYQIALRVFEWAKSIINNETLFN
jgi:HEPN domain-containing protein